MDPPKSAPPLCSTDRDRGYAWPAPLEWASYARLARLRGDDRVPKMIYLDEGLYLMTPSLTHEELADRIDRFVNEVVIGCGLHFRPTGSTTWRRRKKRAGVEGDLTYYLGREPEVRGKKTIDLRRDPPPDLAVEVVYRHAATRALEVYRRLEVPEVWVATERGFGVHTLEGRGGQARYVDAPRSPAFPFLEISEIVDWVYRDLGVADEARRSRDLRDWVRDVLAPRAAAARERD